jgi:hypothetical protein
VPSSSLSTRVPNLRRTSPADGGGKGRRTERSQPRGERPADSSLYYSFAERLGRRGAWSGPRFQSLSPMFSFVGRSRSSLSPSSPKLSRSLRQRKGRENLFFLGKGAAQPERINVCSPNIDSIYQKQANLPLHPRPLLLAELLDESGGESALPSFSLRFDCARGEPEATTRAIVKAAASASDEARSLARRRLLRKLSRGNPFFLR